MQRFNPIERASTTRKRRCFRMPDVSIRFSQVCYLLIVFPVCAQTSKPRLVDQGISFPPSQPLQSVRQDSAALDIIRSYQKAVGVAGWKDIEATGEITPNSAAQNAQQDATLWILGEHAYRLDIQTLRGAISIRIDGANGAMQPPGRKVIPMDARDAVTGIVAFPQLQDRAFQSKEVSLVDQGTVQVDGATLQRLTVEIPWAGSDAKEKRQSGVSITDLYFDPSTHLLFKSANVLQGTDPRLARYMKVVSYGDYRNVHHARIPYQISESLNGKQTWSLQLNKVQLNRGVKETEFRF